MDRDLILRHTPIVGPLQGTPEWLDCHRHKLTASIGAGAIGESEYTQPLDVYHVLKGNIEPFEGNERTDRGNRFEPFLAGEYEIHTGKMLERGLPIQFHGYYQFIGASPDGRWLEDPRHGVELKACNFRQASKLGAEGTDEIFNEWLVQTQIQCLCYQFDVVDVFVMIDLHTYKIFHVERNENLICAIVERLVEFWTNTQAGIEPQLDPKHASSRPLLDTLYGDECQGTVHLTPADQLRWDEYRALKRVIADAEAESDALRNLLLERMGVAQVGVFPSGSKVELTRSIVGAKLWEESDVEDVRAKIGSVKRKAYVTLRERKSK